MWTGLGFGPKASKLGRHLARPPYRLQRGRPSQAASEASFRAFSPSPHLTIDFAGFEKGKGKLRTPTRRRPNNLENHLRCCLGFAHRVEIK